MKIINIIHYELIQLTRDKLGISFMIILPIFFTIITGLMFSNVGGTDGEVQEIQVGLVLEDEHAITKEVLEKVEQDSNIQFISMTNEELVEAIKDQTIGEGYIIPEGFGENILNNQQPVVQIFKNPSSTQFMAVNEAINTTVSTMQLKNNAKVLYRQYMEEEGKTPTKKAEINIESEVEEVISKPLIINKASIYKSNYNKDLIADNKAQSSIGFLVMFVMFNVVFSASSILEEKKHYTWQRLRTTPTDKAKLMLGKLGAAFVTGWIQVIFLMLFGRFIMGVNWGTSIINTIIFVSIFLIAVIALGLLLSSVIKTSSQLGAIASLLITVTSMLGGCWWPIEFSPEYMQRIGMLTPQYWAVKGLNYLIVRDMPALALQKPLLVLFGMAILFTVLSIPTSQYAD